VSRRDVFDSAIDEVIRVEPLTQEGAVALLNPRVFGGVPEAFAALFNCLAGGIPRDLLRTARAALLFSGQDREEELHVTAGRLVQRELAKIAGQVPPEFPGPYPETALHDDSLMRFAESITKWIADDPEREAIGVTIANRIFLLGTVLGIFSRNLDEDTIKAAVGRTSADAHSFTALARAAAHVGVNDPQARASLQAIRTAWGLPPVPSIAG
jgi:hypothetical protein